MRLFPFGVYCLSDCSLIARIISVADAYDALTSQRAFREALPHNYALQILLDGAGQIWDPQLVSIFKSLVNH